MNDDYQDMILDDITECDSQNSNYRNFNADFCNNYDSYGKNLGSEFFSWIEILINAILSAILISVFVFRISTVKGSSMNPTLSENDMLLTVSLGYTPEYNDIVVIYADNLLNKSNNEYGENIVKRIIGIGGDKIYIDSKNGFVYRNDELIVEPYVAELINKSTIGNGEYPLYVPQNCIFVLGDNRNHSTDSRFFESKYYDYYVGFINVNNVIGKVTLRFFPFDSFEVF